MGEIEMSYGENQTKTKFSFACGFIKLQCYIFKY